MAFLSKPFLLLIGGGCSAASICLSNTGAIVNEGESYPEKQEDLLKLKAAAIKEFLKLGGQSKELKDLVKEYASTLTGMKELSRVLTGSLLVDLIESSTGANTVSALKNSLQIKLDNLRLSAVADKGSDVYKSFGGEELYKSYHVLKGIRKAFVEEFANHLTTLVGSASNDLKGSDSADTLIKDKGIGDLYDSVLDDYIKFNKPLFVKKVFWKYDESDQETKAKEMFDGMQLPSDFVYPKTGSYLFPVLSEDSAKKMKEFITKIKDNPNEDNIKQYTDNENDTHEIITASVVEDETKTSQHIIAYLELLSHSISFEQWKDSDKGTSKDNLSTQKENDTDDLCSLTTLTERIPHIITETADNKTYEKLFCVSKDKNPFKENKVPISDFVYLKKKKSSGGQGSSTSGENWILFKDNKGIHAWGIGEQIQENAQNITNLKKKLIEASKKTGTNEHKFDMKKELSSWFEKHFDRLFLAKWKDLVSKIDSSKTDGGDWNGVSEKLKEVLELSFLQESLVSLRYNVTKDYVDLIDKHKPILSGGNIKQINPYLSWAGRFPYKPNDKYLKKSGSSKIKVPFVFDFLESVFLAKYEKLKEEKLSFEQELTQELTQELKSKIEDVSSKVKEKTDSVSSENKSGDDGYKIFSLVSSSTSSSADSKLKNTDVAKAINNLWMSMVNDEGAMDYILFSQLENHLTNLKGYGTPAVFDNSITEQVSNTVYRRFLLSKIEKAFSEVKDPTIYGKLLLEDIKNLKNPNNNLATLVGAISNIYSKQGFDLLSEHQKNWKTESATIEFLAKDKMKNLRKYLKKKVSKEKPAYFLFLKKYDGKGICAPDASNIDKALDVDNIKTRVWEFNNRFLGFDQDANKDWSNLNCLNRDDLSSWIILKADNNFSSDNSKTIIRAGYKGLINADKLSDHLPKELAEKINKNLLPWVNLDDLRSNVQDVKTNDEFESLIKTLKESNSDVNWDFAADAHWLTEDINVKGEKLNLQQRKNILSGFLGVSGGIDKDYSMNVKMTKQKEFAGQHQHTTKDHTKVNNLLSRKKAFMEVEGSKILQDTDGNKYVVYLSQLSFSDLSNDEKWEAFLKETPQDYIAKELINLAMDKSVQKQALYHLWHEKGSTNLAKLQTSDSRLINQRR